MEKAWFKFQQEVEDGQRTLVGVNEFVAPEEEAAPTPYHHQVDSALVDEYLRQVRELKENCSQEGVRRDLENLRRAVEQEDPNTLLYEMECCQALCTTAEMNGVKRIASGQPYDPMGDLEYPFK